LSWLLTPELSPSASPKSQLTHPSGLQQRRYQLPESAGFELVLDLRAATTLISRPPRNSPSPPGQNNANAPVAASFASTATARKSPLQSRQLAETAQDPPLYQCQKPQASYFWRTAGAKMSHCGRLAKLAMLTASVHK